MKNPIVVLCLLLGGMLLCNCHPQKKVVSNENPVGRSFDIVSMPGADSFTGGKPFLQFGASGQLGGNTGCNGFFGEYKLQGNTLAINIQGATKMYCMEVNEEVFFELMQKVESYSLLEKELKLFGNGKLLVVLRQRVGEL